MTPQRALGWKILPPPPPTFSRTPLSPLLPLSHTLSFSPYLYISLFGEVTSHVAVVGKDGFKLVLHHARAHPTPFTLHPTPHTLHPTPSTLHPTPHTLRPAPHTLHPTPCSRVNNSDRACSSGGRKLPRAGTPSCPGGTAASPLCAPPTPPAHAPLSKNISWAFANKMGLYYQ